MKCAFTGHRPQRFSFGFDEGDERCIRLKEMLRQEIAKQIHHGVDTFYSGMALGVDQWAAQLVLELKAEHSQIKLAAVLPCETQANRWSVEQRRRYFDEILPRCDEVILLQGAYTSDCMFKRNRWLVEHAEHLLAVYDGSGKGGTAYTVNYAREKQRAILSIHPDTMEICTNEDFEIARRRSEIRIIK